MGPRVSAASHAAVVAVFCRSRVTGHSTGQIAAAPSASDAFVATAAMTNAPRA